MSTDPRYPWPGTDPAELTSIEDVRRALLITQDTIANLIEGKAAPAVVQMMREERDRLESRLGELVNE